MKAAVASVASQQILTDTIKVKRVRMMCTYTIFNWLSVVFLFEYQIAESNHRETDSLEDSDSETEKVADLILKTYESYIFA